MPQSATLIENRASETGQSRSPRQSKWEAIFLALFVVCLNAVGNLSLAWGMKRIPSVGLDPLAYIGAMLHPFVATGITLLILWLLTRMALMSWADLSFVQPLMGFGYVVAAALGRFVLHEQVGSSQWLGILLIFGGSILVSATPHRSER